MSVPVRVFLAVLAGIFLHFTHPPLNVVLLGWIGLVPLLIAIERATWRSAFILGTISGAVYFGVGGYWLASYKIGAFVVSWAVTSVFVGVFSAVARLIALRVKNEFVRLLIPPLVWTSLAYVLSFTPAASFWAQIAEPQPLVLLQVIAITGVAGLTFLMILANAVTAALIIRGGKPEKFMAVALIALLLLIVAYGNASLNEKVEGTIKVAIVQPNFPNAVEWRVNHTREIFDTYKQLAVKAHGVDLIVLPLYTVPGNISRFSGEMWGVARAAEAYVSVGTYEGNINVAQLYSPEGELISEYVAVHKPPFRNQTPGTEYVVADTELGKIGMILCFDTTDEKTIRQFPKRDAALLLSMANDGLFLGTEEPEMHLGVDILRAVQNRRWIARAVPSGISAIIDPYGRILKRGNAGKQEILFGNVGLVQYKTIFTRAGDIVSPLSAIMLLAVIVKTMRGKERRKRK